MKDNIFKRKRLYIVIDVKEFSGMLRATSKWKLGSLIVFILHLKENVYESTDYITLRNDTSLDSLWMFLAR